MNLPFSDTLPVQYLSSIFNKTTNSYKFYWFLAILESIKEQDVRIISINSLLAKMLTLVWYPVNYYRLSFGKLDRLGNIALEIKERLQIHQDVGVSDLNDELIKLLNSDYPRILASKVKSLKRYVCFRLLRPWFADELRGIKDTRVNDAIVQLAGENFREGKKMARFTENQLNTLKSEVSLVRLIENQGYKIHKEGKDHKMNCPFHDDATPSLKISNTKNLFNCFGCGVSGTVIDWVMKTQGLSFRHACEILMNDAGMSLDASSVKKNTTPKLASPLTANTDNQTILNQVIDYYHQELKQSPEALAYLKKRGLECPRCGMLLTSLNLVQEYDPATGRLIRFRWLCIRCGKEIGEIHE